MDFNIGQEVVCVLTHTERIVIKSNHYKILGLRTECKCGLLVDVGARSFATDSPNTRWRCSDCGQFVPFDKGIWWLHASLFAPLMDISELESILKEQTLINNHPLLR